MRNRFEQELESLKNSLLEMGGLIERAIELAVLALRNQDAAAARRAVAFDQETNEKERAIEHLCLKLLLQQQPVAADLRLISASLKMITDMERIGDQAADISEITLRLTGRPYIKKMVHIPQMAAASSKMVRQSIDAFVSGDLALAGEIVRMDDEVDRLFCVVRADLARLTREDAQNGEQAMDLLMVAKYFERIGDHAVNLAEWVIFSITGHHPKD